MPNRRTGTLDSRRSVRVSIRDASENSTSASVASANVRTVELFGAALTSSSSSGPTSTPIATNTIAGVTGVLESCRETAATASTASATMARVQVTEAFVVRQEDPWIAMRATPRIASHGPSGIVADGEAPGCWGAIRTRRACGRL